MWLYEPTGTGSPRTGGTCGDNQRPVMLVIHGYPAQEWLPLTEPATPDFYWSLITNLVSNGYIVVFANYDNDIVQLENTWLTVWVGFVQAVKGIPTDNPWDLPAQSRMTSRANLLRIGLWGHSFGGGMTPMLSLMAAAETIPDDNPATPDPHWGDDGLWVAMYAATDLMYHCNIDDDDSDGQPFNGRLEPTWPYLVEDDETDLPWFPTSRPMATYCNPTRHPVVMPPNARVLIVSYEGDYSVDGSGNRTYPIRWASERLYLDMSSVQSKWSILVKDDCSHHPCASTPYTTSHMTPVDPVAAIPSEYREPVDHLKWYGTNRNLQVLAECAIFEDSRCNTNLLLPMGTWTDGEPATPASTFIPPP